MNQIIEPHAFGTYAPSGAEILIIGTFPTHKRNREFEFFYPNKQNVFWEILANIYNYNFQHPKDKKAVEERKAFAKQHKIALTDMLSQAIREKDISGDNQLIPLELMDILAILKANKAVRRIILTSRSGKNSALNLFKCHLINNRIAFFESSEQDKIIFGHFENFGNNYEVIVPYSPSPRVKGPYGIDYLIEMYRVALTKNF